MVQGALGKLPAPNTIYAFTGDGKPAPEAQAEMRAEYEKKGTDATRLNLVAHGSPGKMAALKDLDKFFGSAEKDEKDEDVPGRFGQFFHGEITNVDLYTCWAMTKRDVDEQSVAERIAKAIQSAAGAEQTVKLRAGYTPNTAGEFAQGQPSYQPVTPRTILEAAEISLWFAQYLAGKGKTDREAPKKPAKDPEKDSRYVEARRGWQAQRDAYHIDLSTAAEKAIKEILAELPKQEPPQQEQPPRDSAVEMEISRSHPLDPRLRQQPFTAVAAAHAGSPFPERLAAALGWPQGAEKIEGILAKHADWLVGNNADWFGTASGASQPLTSPSSFASEGFTFGAAPTQSTGFTFGAAPTQSTGFTFDAPPTQSTGFTFLAPPTQSTGFTFDPEEKKPSTVTEDH